MFPCCVFTRNLQLRSLKYAAALFFRMYQVTCIRYHGSLMSTGALMMGLICRKRATTRVILSCFGPRAGLNCTTPRRKGEGVKCLISNLRCCNGESCTRPSLSPFKDKAVDDERMWQKRALSSKTTSHPRHYFGALNISGFTQTSCMSFTNLRPVWKFCTFYSNSEGCRLCSNITAFLGCTINSWSTGRIELWLMHSGWRQAWITGSLTPFQARQIPLACSHNSHVPLAVTQPSAVHHISLPACNCNRSR